MIPSVLFPFFKSCLIAFFFYVASFVVTGYSRLHPFSSPDLLDKCLRHNLSHAGEHYIQVSLLPVDFVPNISISTSGESNRVFTARHIIISQGPRTQHISQTEEPVPPAHFIFTRSTTTCRSIRPIPLVVQDWQNIFTQKILGAMVQANSKGGDLYGHFSSTERIHAQQSSFR
jgi:hypothetical protein